MYQHKNGLTLRKMGYDDLVVLSEMKADSWTTQHQSVLLNSQDQQQFLSKMNESNRDFYLIALNSDVIIGIVNVCNIDWISRMPDVGMMATKRCRGKKNPGSFPSWSRICL